MRELGAKRKECSKDNLKAPSTVKTPCCSRHVLRAYALSNGKKASLVCRYKGAHILVISSLCGIAVGGGEVERDGSDDYIRVSRFELLSFQLLAE